MGRKNKRNHKMDNLHNTTSTDNVKKPKNVIINPEQLSFEFLRILNTIYETSDLTNLNKCYREFSTVKFNQHVVRGVQPIVDFFKIILQSMRFEMMSSNVVPDGTRRLNILVSGKVTYTENQITQQLQMPITQPIQIQQLLEQQPILTVTTAFFSMYIHLAQFNDSYWIQNQQITINL